MLPKLLIAQCSPMVILPPLVWITAKGFTVGAPADPNFARDRTIALGLTASGT